MIRTSQSGSSSVLLFSHRDGKRASGAVSERKNETQKAIWRSCFAIDCLTKLSPGASFQSNGDREAQSHLAFAFEEGKGVNRDLVTAYAWYRCAEANLSASPLVDEADEELARDTKAAIARIVEKLSIEQVREFKVLAQKYIQAFPFSSQWLVSPARKTL